MLKRTLRLLHPFSRITVYSPSQQIVIRSRSNFSTNVWGERTIQWIDDEISRHMQDHEGDYDFDTVAYLGEAKSVGFQRKAIVTPCVQQATTSYLIDVLLKQSYIIRGIALPESSEQFIESRFKMKNALIQQQRDTFDGKEIDVKVIEDGDLKIEQRIVESFKLNSDELETFDVIFDEMPLLKYEESIQNAKVNTTILGHGLKKGGLLYLQCEGAKDRKQRIALIESIQSYYPETHFDLVESRRTPWTRQFLFLKADSTC